MQIFLPSDVPLLLHFRQIPATLLRLGLGLGFLVCRPLQDALGFFQGLGFFPVLPFRLGKTRPGDFLGGEFSPGFQGRHLRPGGLQGLFRLLGLRFRLFLGFLQPGLPLHELLQLFPNFLQFLLGLYQGGQLRLTPCQGAGDAVFRLRG